MSDTDRCPNCGITPAATMAAMLTATQIRPMSADVRVSIAEMRAKVERHDAECKAVPA